MESKQLNLNIEDWYLRVLQPRSGEPSDQAYIEGVYSFWHKIWADALNELEGLAQLSSDHFNRQDQILAVYYKNEIMGTASFLAVDLQQSRWRMDSYFLPWPTETLQAIQWEFSKSKILIGSWFTLSPNFRYNRVNFSAKRLLMCLVVEHFLNSQCAAMLGTMRVNRGMHTISYETGAKEILRNIKHHGIDVDLLIWEKSASIECLAKSQYSHLARAIYRELMTTDPKSIFKGNDPSFTNKQKVS